jgi:4-amino-4-deoxy-L-arabinose transferase-like glycosyltransferase
MADRSRSLVDYLLLAGFCGFLFFFGLNYFGLVGADEPRYAQIAREMLVRHDWITPTLGGKPWLEKPVLYYWQAMVAYRVFGVSDWAARLPSAFDASLMIVTVYLFLRKFRPTLELDGALITASSAGVIGFARAASTDMPIASMFTIAMLCWWAWNESARKLYLGMFFFFIALATLAKGPVAVALAVIILTCHALAVRDYSLIRRTLWVPGVMLYCAIALPWFVLVQIRNPEVFQIFILEHNLARFGTNLYHHMQPFWYYIPVMLLALLPWTVLVIWAISKYSRSWQRTPELSLFLLIWFLAPMVLFSISRSKLPGYILPALPAGTLFLIEQMTRAKEGFRHWVLAVHSAFAALLLAPAMLLPYLLLTHHFPGSAILAAAISAVLAIAIFVTVKNRPGLSIVRFVTLIPVVLSVAAILKLGAPALDETLSARPVAAMISRLQADALPIVVSGVSRETEYGLHFYRNTQVYRYERGEQPSGEHMLIAPSGVQPQSGGRRILHLASLPAHSIDYYWVAGK